jgi:hypothetical protein
MLFKLYCTRVKLPHAHLSITLMKQAKQNHTAGRGFKFTQIVLKFWLCLTGLLSLANHLFNLSQPHFAKPYKFQVPYL